MSEYCLASEGAQLVKNLALCLGVVSLPASARLPIAASTCTMQKMAASAPSSRLVLESQEVAATGSTASLSATRLVSIEDH